ncbi:MAG: metalloregulator ArsR/SmtB family transcription factor [Candidatus Sericytochromatia bacterium]|nr:metalloregulator ArsR/SmtB family transcription factor [Candidatus Sericytochromatia bacterium]
MQLDNRPLGLVTLSEHLSALSEPLRLRICRLLEQQELSVGEIATVVQVPQSTISRHLKVLSQVGWLQRRTDGTAGLYRLDIGGQPLAAAVWQAIRESISQDVQTAEDMRRLERVLLERRTDSQSFFSRLGGDWDAVRDELFGRAFAGRALLGLLPRRWAVADLGCGTGSGTEMLAPFVRQVVAVDQSAPMLQAARERLARHDNVRFVESPLEDLPLETASLDAAICTLVLHHVDDPPAVLREMARVLRPGGQAIVVDMVAHDREAYRQTMGHRHLGFSAVVIGGLLSVAGFGDVRICHLPAEPEVKGPSLFVATAIVGADTGPTTTS